MSVLATAAAIAIEQPVVDAVRPIVGGEDAQQQPTDSSLEPG